MGNNSAQNTYSSWVEQDTHVLGFADRELGRPVDPACGHAAPNPVRRATPLAVAGNTVREAPTPLLPPGERVGAPTPRCIPLFASVIQCSARTPGTVCVSAPIPSFSRVCPMGHTVLPTASTVFRRFVDKCLPA
ncbi:hypothetical protein ABIE52_006997 [Rhodococcus sp. OAS809]